MKKHVKQSENENSQLKTTNAVILKNISSLYKTATKEIQRKDTIIQELRMKYIYITIIYAFSIINTLSLLILLIIIKLYTISGNSVEDQN